MPRANSKAVNTSCYNITSSNWQDSPAILAALFPSQKVRHGSFRLFQIPPVIPVYRLRDGHTVVSYLQQTFSLNTPAVCN